MTESSHVVIITDALNWLRDLSFIGGVGAVIWQARGIWDGVKGFTEKVEVFMGVMTMHAEALVSNHLRHLEQSSQRIETALNKQNDLLTEMSRAQKPRG